MKKQNGGFTMVELMIVVTLIGLLAAVAIPVFVRSSEARRSGLIFVAPTMGQLYQKKATDSGRLLVIAMPWKLGQDEAGQTERRLMLQVNEEVSNAPDESWFLSDKDGVCHVVSAPEVVEGALSRKWKAEDNAGF